MSSQSPPSDSGLPEGHWDPTLVPVSSLIQALEKAVPIIVARRKVFKARKFAAEIARWKRTEDDHG